MEVLAKDIESQLERATNAYCFPFYLITAERRFLLYTTSDEDRNMWLDGFSYLIMSTKELKLLAADNNNYIKSNIQENKEKGLDVGSIRRRTKSII